MSHPDSTSAPISRRALLALAAASPFVPLPALAQGDWPSRPVRLLVPFSAGGAADTSARAVCQRVAELIGQTITVDNRTGGNAVVAAGVALQSPKDGYTFIWDAANQLTNPVLLKDLAFDYRTAFTPITMAVRAPQALLESLLEVEAALGRERPYRNAPRRIDLDFLLGTDEAGAPIVVDTALLQLPHPRLHQRAFALAPLAELDPSLEVPGYGSVATLLHACAEQRVEREAPLPFPIRRAR